jgi:hypothetical protein
MADYALAVSNAEIYTAIDDCTRLRVLRIYERLDQKTAIRFVDYVLEQLPFKVMQTDNGSEVLHAAVFPSALIGSPLYSSRPPVGMRVGFTFAT